MRWIIAAAMSLMLGACATSTPTGGRPVSTATSGISYGLARSYYQVRVIAKPNVDTRTPGVGANTSIREDRVFLVIDGPLPEIARTEQLDLRHSGFSADRFDIDIGPNSMLETLSFASDGRSNAVAYNIGAAIAAAASSSGGAQRNLEGAEVPDVAFSAEDIVLFDGRWRMGAAAADNAATLANINASLQGWWSAACGTPSRCLPAAPPQIDLSSAAFPAITTAQPNCALVICYPSSNNLPLQVRVLNPPAPRAARGAARGAERPHLLAGRTLEINQAVLNPDAPSFFNARQASLGGGLAQFGFTDSALSYAAYARESEIESATMIPFDFFRGVLNTLSNALPIRIIIDTRRNQLQSVHADNTTKTPEGAETTAPQIQPAQTGSVPSALQAIANDMIEARATISETILIGAGPSRTVRSAPPAESEQPPARGAGNTGGAAPGGDGRDESPN